MIKTFEIFTQLKEPGNAPSILFINGSSGWLKDDLSLNINRRNQLRSNILSQFGDQVIYGSVYWRAGEIIFEEMIEIMESRNVKAVVGYSAGGYISFHLSNYYKVPAMSVNPAMASTSEAPILQPLPDEFKNIPIYGKQLVVVGEKDTKADHGVDMPLVVEDLKKMGFENKGGEFLFLKDTYHRVSPEQFDSCFKYFYKNFVK
jgi:hypothetical protein